MHLLRNSVDHGIEKNAERGEKGNGKISLDFSKQKDGLLITVSDDGRGMPVDIHPEHKVSGVELILCKLHAGAKFSGEEYNFSGGLHGVGVSVVNALSDSLQVNIKRDSKEHEMHFDNGHKKSELKILYSFAFFFFLTAPTIKLFISAIPLVNFLLSLLTSF